MESQIEKLNQQTLTYLLQQGRSIGVLNELLLPKKHILNINTRFILFTEIFLYCLIVCIIALVVYIPTEIITNFPLGRSFGFDIGFKNEELQQLLFLIKIALIILSIPILAFAIVLRHNRLKNKMIRKAFIETEWMKLAFQKAIKDLDLYNKK